MNYQQTNIRLSSSDIFDDIEKRIKNGFFKNKEEVSKYIFSLKERGFLTQEEISRRMPQVLGIYDNLNQTSDISINMENYRGVSLENQNLIVATEEARILKTEENPQKMKQEFTELQNELIATNGDAAVNADEVFNKMAETKKEELSLVPLSEVLMRENIDKEILQKIKFFVTNKYINPSIFKMDVENGIFYNVETSEVLEVRKDASTNQFHIYKGGVIMFEENQEIAYEEQQEKIIDENMQEEIIYENENELVQSKPKTRVLRPPHMNNYNNAAFSKMNFLLLIIGMFTASIVFINILSKFIK